jgi:putative flippase GtrA
MNNLRALYEKYEEIIKYVIVGGLTTIVSMACFYISVWTFLDGNDPVQLQVANVISWVGGVAFAYVTNRTIVFQSHNAEIWKELVKFVSSRVLTLFLDMGVMFILATLLHINYNISKLISMVLVMVGNYIISKLLVFKS